MNNDDDDDDGNSNSDRNSNRICKNKTFLIFSFELERVSTDGFGS